MGRCTFRNLRLCRRPTTIADESTAAVSDTEAVLTAIVERWDGPLRGGLLRPSGDWLKRVAPDRRSYMENLVGNYSNAVVRLAQLQAVVEDTAKLGRMVRLYPWDPNDLSKSEHLHFVWFCFTGHCYLFEERSKLFYDDWNRIRDWFDLEAVNGGPQQKRIKKKLGEYIRHRGVFTHQHNEIHISYKSLQMVEFMHDHFPDEERDVEGHYIDSVEEMDRHIVSALVAMRDEFLAIDGNPQEELLAMADRIEQQYHLCRVRR